MMKQFLLLRSNRQTGPYSAEELQQMGLKAYDLIWVDGKSAAWRYPGEIEELKSFAPPVEEQPYDRFYKKPEPEQKKQELPAETPFASVTPPAKPVQPTENKPSQKKDKEYKRIFVTLPSAGTAQAPVQKPAAAQPPPPAFGTSLQEPVGDVDFELPAPQQFPRAKAEAKKTVRKEDIRDTKDEVYYPSRRSINKKPVVLALSIAGMAALVALGIFIGLSIDNNGQGVSLVKKTDPVTGNTIVPANQQSNAANNSNNTDEPLVGEIPQNEQAAVSNTPIKPPAAKKQQTTADSAQQQLAVTVPVKSDSDQVVKEKEEVKKPVPRPVVPNLEKQVAVTTNDYQVGPFGGISKLELTVKNSSDYILNLVVVQVEYLKANKEVFKTENLYFRDIEANSSLTLEAPRSGRGNKVNYKVTLINSKDHLYHAGN